MNISEKYVKLDQREHVLQRSGMYIGSIEEDKYDTWLYDCFENRIVKREVKYVPGLFKIFDEILVNAIDHSTRLKIAKQTNQDVNCMKTIKVSIDKDNGDIEVFNDGDGIEVVRHPEHNIYIPELIFGNMLTSTNYDDNVDRIIGGTNGVGSKCISPDTKIPMFDGSIKLARDIVVGDELIGDDGRMRTVLNTITGTGRMYEISQVFGETYKVNENHVLTLHMPDHKVIFWNANGWSILWWDRERGAIRSKKSVAFSQSCTCGECGMMLHSSINRHYKRHHGKMAPVKPRKSPTKCHDMQNEDIARAYQEIQEFAKTIDDDNVIDIAIKDYLKLPKSVQRRLVGLRGNCVEWDYQHVELDPYVLGLWLGDGVYNGYRYVCDGDKDTEIMEYLNNWGEINDAKFKQTSSVANFRKKYCSTLKKLIEKYDLVKNKHVPKEYIVNSRDVRLKVLAGMIDTNGSVQRDGTRVSITQGINHKTLIHDLTYLARSLGFCCSLTKGTATYTWKGKKKTTDVLNLNISGNIDDIPTRLPRKKCSTTKVIDTDKTMGHLKIEEIGEGEFVGFKIDGNERFVINDFTVTHNCSNIYSEWFEVETVDRLRKLHYVQKFESNMSIVNPPSITKYTKKPFTIIRFKPDYERFKLQGLTKDIYEMFIKRVYDACAVTDSDITIYLNDTKLDFKNFEKYVDLYIGNKNDHTRVYEQVNDRWEIVASYNDFNGFDQVSFVNGIWTLRGGKHVDYILNQIIKKLTELIVKKNKNVNIKPQNIKDNLILFIKSTIVNPTFDSQSKETLTTPITKFGSKAELSDKFIEKLYKSGIADKILQICEMNNNKELKKTDGKKRNIIKGIAKLDDANWAGTSKSKECTLILTEGDSAKTMVLAGLSQVGRDKYGVFPLKGKVMNVKDTSVKKISDNEEITNLKKILGLETGKEYKTLDDLRYGKIMLMTDADHDGLHIKALLFNLFQTLWPSLFTTPNFLTSMLTPIIKVTNNRSKSIISFYSQSDYDDWKTQQENNKTFQEWKIKYYKGLGTSTNDEAQEYFKNLNIVSYKYDKNSDFSLDLAFNKKRADDRKLWLSQYDKSANIDYQQKEVTYEDFINKELIQFSNYDIERSIPSLVDGLKTSQRKILFGCLKRNLVNDEIRVAQLASFVSEHSCYHHGEASLQGAIVGMAQNFVGGNNINILKPIGQFGSRIHLGKDAGAPRYIYTMLEKISTIIFNKEDHRILKYLDDDGIPVEPEYYVPIIPMVLVNGALGIGTGFSTNIPCFNPKEIVAILKLLLAKPDEFHASSQLPELTPWYMGFEGTIQKQGDKFVSVGKFTKLSSTKVEVTELPIGYATQDFKELLEEMLDKDLKQYDSNYTDKKVHFTLHFPNAEVVDKYMQLENNGFTKFENDFKLVSSKNLSTTNMYLFNSKGMIQKYETPQDIIWEYYNTRLHFFSLRKNDIIQGIEEDLKYLYAKIRFIQSVIVEEVKVSKMKKDELEKFLNDNNYPLLNDKFDYILRIPIYNLTIDKVKELENDITKAEGRLEDVQTKTEQEMWLDELSAFEKEYAHFLETYLSTSVSVSKKGLRKNHKI